MEKLPYGCGDFISDLLEDMSWRPVRWLSLHYPELHFGLQFGKRPSGHDYVKEMGHGRYRVADWRTK